MEANRSPSRWTYAEYARPTAPEITGDRSSIRWTPVFDGPTLDVRVSDILP
jgi:hypothetical protein